VLLKERIEELGDSPRSVASGEEDAQPKLGDLIELPSSQSRPAVRVANPPTS
jgi:hypothetical protein